MYFAHLFVPLQPCSAYEKDDRRKLTFLTEKRHKEETMQLDTQELGVLAEMLAAQKMEQLEKELQRERDEKCYWKARCEKSEEVMAAVKLDNLFLRNYIVLSMEKVKQFVVKLTNVGSWSFLRTFMQDVLPDELQQQELPLVNQMMPMPDEHGANTVTNNFNSPVGIVTTAGAVNPYERKEEQI